MDTWWDAMIIRSERLPYYVEYTLNDKFHRPNGPAVEWLCGTWDWYLFGYPHRYYGYQTNTDDEDEDYDYVGNRPWVIHGECVNEC